MKHRFPLLLVCILCISAYCCADGVPLPISDREVTVEILTPNDSSVFVTVQEGKPIRIENTATGEIYVLVPVVLDEETTTVKFSLFGVLFDKQGNESFKQVERFVTSLKRQFYLENTQTEFSMITQTISRTCNPLINKLGDAECSGGNCTLECSGGYRVTGCRVVCETGCCYCEPCAACPVAPPKLQD